MVAVIGAHRPVLLDEVLEALQIKPSGVYVDGTFGRGGHSRAILERLDADGRLVAMDKDPEAVKWGRERLGQDERFSIEQGSFAMLEHVVEGRGFAGLVDGILLDLGVSSPQLDDPARGFSFLRDGPLDMRMDPAGGHSAAQWLARADEREIAEVLKTYGEERHARRIARAIVAAGREAPITTTGRLAEVVAKANPAWEQGKHPATRAFQAIRIFINRELDDLQDCLEQCLAVLAPGGKTPLTNFRPVPYVEAVDDRHFRLAVHADSFPLTFSLLATKSG